jgi:Ca2+-binding EF-hand superfamily protein
LFGQVIFYWTLIARLLSREFDSNPNLRPLPTPLPESVKPVPFQIVLSAAEEDQICEIFELFDTDGEGSIDKTELEFAMAAMGFKSVNNHASSLLSTIAGDGKVNLTKFSSLVTGEVLGSNQFEDILTVFAALSKPDGESRHDNLITLQKLENVCLEYKVCSDNL